MTTQHLFDEEAVSWVVDDIRVHATLTRPEGTGPFPAVIFVSRQRPNGPELEYSPDPRDKWQRGIACPCVDKKRFYHLTV